MRIDKIIDKITKIIFSPKLISEILDNKIPFSLKIFSFFITGKKKILLLKKGKFKGINNIEGIQKYNISANSFDSKNKKNGISAIARLKNGEEFLNITIESIINYVDEIILLVDTNGSDNTENICKDFANKYPNKCKFYDYEPLVYPGNHEKYSTTPDNSVHALSYFYNYCMSKVNYKYVMKLDDDMMCIENNFLEMSQLVNKNKGDYFLALPQINISKNTHGEYSIPNKYLHSGIAGLFGDHGIFPISEKTYFFNDTGCENLIMPYKIKYGKISFLHLKNIKSDHGLKNYTGYAQEYVKELWNNSSYISLPKKYKKPLDKII